MRRSETFDDRQFAARSLRHHWRVNLAVMFGVVAGTAVLTGALIVGDSVRYSLKRLTLERLGAIDQILIADHFFGTDLCDRMQLAERPLASVADVVPVIIMPQATIEAMNGGQRATQVTLVGTDQAFWSLGPGGPRPERLPTGRQIVLNASLAEDLGVKIGDQLVVRLPRENRVAGDSPLGEKDRRIESLAELEVTDILPNEGLGRFSMEANQSLPRTAFLEVRALQDALQQAGKVNAVLIAGPRVDQTATAAQVADLRTRIRPNLSDAGLRLSQVELTYAPSPSDAPIPTFDYVSLSTDKMMFSPRAAEVVRLALHGLDYQSVFTYLANSITADSGSSVSSIPYSTIAAIDDNAQLSPLLDEDGELIELPSSDSIVLNQWAANDLGVKPGDRVSVSYFAPETTHGEAVEEVHEFTLTAVAPLRSPDTPYRRNRSAQYTQPPFRTNDPYLTPDVPGVTDQDSIDDWDPPFPFDYTRIRNPEDEDYWDDYRTTPKAFIRKRTGDELWGSRFGNTTLFRIRTGAELSFDQLAHRLSTAVAGDFEAFGFALLEVKRDGLNAAQGTTPFNLLFLGFSLFIITAALMLVCLLFRLNIEQRSRETGLLISVGWTARHVGRLFLREAAVISFGGVILGSVLGIAYAWAMIYGLRTWWLDAVVTPFLQLHMSWWSLLIGAFAGSIASLLTIFITIVGLRRVAPRNLLTRNTDSDQQPSRTRRRNRLYLAGTLWAAAIGASISAVFLSGEAQAGAFFGAGACALAAMLIQISWWLRRPAIVQNPRRFGFSLRRLILRNLGRNSLRSTLTIGLTAMACFLIIAISAFRLAPTRAGTGGFQLFAEADVPIFEDLDSDAVRNDLMGSAATDLQEVKIVALRDVPGDDASCRNLYQARRPRLLGMTPKFMEYFDAPENPGFGWTGTEAENDRLRHNPWRLLNASADDAIPVVLDKNTAMYSLHLYGGVGEEFELDYGATAGKLRFRVVGLLANSILQGSLMISEAVLVDRFPDVSGYGFFLIQTPAGRQAQVSRVLEETFRDEGLRVGDTRRRLADLLAVQNTYLSTFQSLGGLGLLLGTFGLVAVQLRNVFERRSELALLRATGFGQRRLTALVLGEHFALLAGGLFVGLLAALVAVVPQSWTTEVSPPWRALAFVLGVILCVGMITGYLALRPLLRSSILGALRGD